VQRAGYGKAGNRHPAQDVVVVSNASGQPAGHRGAVVAVEGGDKSPGLGEGDRDDVQGGH
jgi:hypothetical protein